MFMFVCCVCSVEGSMNLTWPQQPPLTHVSPATAGNVGAVGGSVGWAVGVVGMADGAFVGESVAESKVKGGRTWEIKGNDKEEKGGERSCVR